MRNVLNANAARRKRRSSQVAKKQLPEFIRMAIFLFIRVRRAEFQLISPTAEPRRQGIANPAKL
jgi:hypothetical protein